MPHKFSLDRHRNLHMVHKRPHSNLNRGSGLMGYPKKSMEKAPHHNLLDGRGLSAMSRRIEPLQLKPLRIKL